MIDVESVVFNTVRTAMLAEFPSLQMDSRYVDLPAKFPALNLFEASNTVATNRSSSTGIERGVRVMYQADIYSNALNNRKWQAQTIRNKLDEVMTELGFTRTSVAPMSSDGDAKIYRIAVRYEALITPTSETDVYHIFQP